MRFKNRATNAHVSWHSVSYKPQAHKLDIWLPRFSSLAQVVLLFVTAGSLYFTVLPLYQKALLDEAIAKKELELKAATASIEKKYGQLRHLAVREYVFFAGPDCSGIMRRISEKTGKPEGPDNTLTINVKECLLNLEAKTQALNELSQDDRLFFRQELSRVGDQLGKAQMITAELVDHADKDVSDTNFEEFFSKRPLAAQYISLMSKLVTPERLAAYKWQIAIDELRSERIKAYRDQMHEQLFGLLKLKWPVPKP